MKQTVAAFLGVILVCFYLLPLNGQEIADSNSNKYEKFPERVRKIAEGMEKLGLSPKIDLSPKIGEGSEGYIINAKIGEEKPGEKFTNITVYVATEDSIQQFLVFPLVGFVVEPREELTPAPLWTGKIADRFKGDGLGTTYGAYITPGVGGHIIGVANAYAMKNDVIVSVRMERCDTKPRSYYSGISEFDGEKRAIELSAGLKDDSRNWIDALVKIIDGLGGVKISVFDANPQYNDKFDFTDKAVLKDFPSKEAYLQKAAYVVSVANTKRSGAAADGVSLLLLLASVDYEGIATFTLEGDDSPGTIHPIGTDFDMKLREKKIRTPTLVLERGPDSKQYWAAVLYRPPDNFGRGDGTREVRVTLLLENTGGKKIEDNKDSSSKRGECMIRLIRPPVVLVHGTFDAPIPCWDTPDQHSSFTMKKRLEQEGFRPFMVDWVETNGYKDPSAFISNCETVWKNNGGIHEALETFRKDNFAATQADLVCHSQGGVIARRYVKGTVSETKLADDDYHYTNPRECSRGACYYHRLNNFAKGDIHRLITISATHMGSDICSLLNVFIQLRSEGMKLASWDSLCAKLALLGGGYQGNCTSDWMVVNFAYYTKEFIRRMGNGELTGAYKDQIPGSPALQAIGKTLVPSHAIACTAEDKDLMDFDGSYEDRMETIWEGSSRGLLLEAFRKLGQNEDADDLARRVDEQERAEGLAAEIVKLKVMRTHRMANARRFRAAVFGNNPNDCTVRRESSLGGLPEQYTTTIPNILHGYAPWYSAVQERVVQLLKDDGGKFCSAGFPQAGVMPRNIQYIGPSVIGPELEKGVDQGSLPVGQ
ncbi:MAG: hypothetical protein WCI77_06985 [Candidatus Omnitrophota bacterium]